MVTMMNVDAPNTKADKTVGGSSRAAERILTLDGIRGIAIAMVMLFHFFGIYRLHFHFMADLESLSTFESVVLKAAGAGWVGVDLFFVLSGFLITGILYDAKGPGRQYFRTFYARRALRILPVYYGFLILLMVLLPVLGESAAQRSLGGGLAWYGSFLSNIRDVFDPGLRGDFLFVGHIWSLAVEEQFYLVWPVFVFLFSRRTLLWICGMGAVCALALRVSFEMTDVPPGLGFTLTPARMDALAVGAFIALSARSAGDFSSLLRWAPLAAALNGFAVVLLGVVRGGFTPFDPWVRTVGLSGVAILFGAFVVLAIGQSPQSRAHGVLANPALRWLGRYSYAAYLFHAPIANLLGRRADFIGNTPTLFGTSLPGEAVFVVIAGSISLAVAWLSWRVWESQFLKLKRYFPYARHAGVPAPAP